MTGVLDALGVSRIDHGNRALEYPALTARLVREQMPMTMCPLSNLRLKGIPSMDRHPLKIALDASLLVTVNSDDPLYFGGYVNENYKTVHQALDLSGADLTRLAQNSFVASFFDDAEKQAGLDAVRDYAAGIS